MEAAAPPDEVAPTPAVLVVLVVVCCCFFVYPSLKVRFLALHKRKSTRDDGGGLIGCLVGAVVKCFCSTSKSGKFDIPLYERASSNSPKLLSDGLQAATFAVEGSHATRVAKQLLGDEKIHITDGVLSQQELVGLSRFLRGCEYFGENQLGSGNITNPYFRGSQGFSLSFRRSHIDTMLQHFPSLAGCFEKVLLPDCNVFYMNVLSCRPDGQEFHVDEYYSSTLREYRPCDIVTLLYLETSPGLVGGELVLLDGSPDRIGGHQTRGKETCEIVAKVKPVGGRMVHFQGNLVHAVYPFFNSEAEQVKAAAAAAKQEAGKVTRGTTTANAGSALDAASPPPFRIGVVCEQYKLKRRQVLLVPRCKVFDQRRNVEIDLTSADAPPPIGQIAV
jgi:hypothetical protein